MTIADLNLEARALVDADSTSLTDATLLRRVNSAYEEVVGKLIGLDGTWQFDDTNFTDLPIGITDLVAGQGDYSFDATHLEVERVEILDNNGKWLLMRPIDKSDITVALEEYFITDGLPTQYDKQGGSVILYPAPSAAETTLTNGLKLYFQRTASIYTSAEVTTGTKTPGFASPYHVLLAYKMALPYAMSYKKDRVPLFLNEINRLEDGLLKHYARREKDVRKRLNMAGVNSR